MIIHSQHPPISDGISEFIKIRSSLIYERQHWNLLRQVGEHYGARTSLLYDDDTDDNNGFRNILSKKLLTSLEKR